MFKVASNFFRMYSQLRVKALKNCQWPSFIVFIVICEQNSGNFWGVFRTLVKHLWWKLREKCSYLEIFSGPNTWTYWAEKLLFTIKSRLLLSQKFPSYIFCRILNSPWIYITFTRFAYVRVKVVKNFGTFIIIGCLPWLLW